MKKQKETNIKGIRIRSANIGLIVLSCIFYVLIIFATVQISLRYEGMIRATDDHISCEKDAALVSDGSDYLTERVRLYAVTSDIQYAQEYFTELNVTKRREKALEQLQDHNAGGQAEDYLQTALDNSNLLTKREIYSMKLISTANGYLSESLPKEVQSTELTPEDAALSAEEMLEKGRMMVFDEEYKTEKAAVMDNITRFTDSVTAGTWQKQAGMAESLKHVIVQQRVLISILFALNILVFILLIVLVIRPIRAYIDSIRQGEMLKVTGSYECRYLAQTYNNIYQLNEANEELLQQKAEHDPLTELMNRGAFEQIERLFQVKQIPIALLLIRVDGFSQITGSRGQGAGDGLLKQIAALLREEFREKDFPARIEEDLFAVTMTNITSLRVSVIRRKVERLNEKLQNPQNGLPKASLSVGVAFSGEGFADSLYDESEQALHAAEEHGGGSCVFYGEEA